MNLTDRQRSVLELFVRERVAGNPPPTRTEVAAHFGWASSNAAQRHVDALAKKGALRVARGHRGVIVTPDGMKEVVGDHASCS